MTGPGDGRLVNVLLSSGDPITVRIGSRAFIGHVTRTGADGEARGTLHGWRVDVDTGQSWDGQVYYGSPSLSEWDHPADLSPPDDIPVNTVVPDEARGGDGAADRPMVATLAEADRWIRVHHRWAVRDIEAITALADRVRVLENTPVRRLLRRIRRWE